MLTKELVYFWNFLNLFTVWSLFILLNYKGFRGPLKVPTEQPQAEQSSPITQSKSHFPPMVVANLIMPSYKTVWHVKKKVLKTVCLSVCHLWSDLIVKESCKQNVVRKPCNIHRLRENPIFCMSHWKKRKIIFLLLKAIHNARLDNEQ